MSCKLEAETVMRVSQNQRYLVWGTHNKVDSILGVYLGVPLFMAHYGK